MKGLIVIMIQLPFPESLLALIGLILLGIGFHGRHRGWGIVAAPGWILLGFYFFLGTDQYVELGDPVLIIMSAATLPLGIALGFWERSVHHSGRVVDSLVWFRGAVLWSGLPYLLVEKVPWLSVLAIWLVAWQTTVFMGWSGAGDIHLGNTWVNEADGTRVDWNQWDGNRWFLEGGEVDHVFTTDLLWADGSSTGITFVLACTALQSMIIFVGAVGALQSAPWKRRVRALMITLPLIHILNLFRNSGLIWMHTSLTGWSWLQMDIFAFGHSYAAKAGSLAAMFLMALVLFELLPQLHRHILDLLGRFKPGRPAGR